MCGVTHSHVWRDSFACVAWLIRMCGVTHSHVWRDSFACVAWLIHMCDVTHSYVWRDSIIYVACFIHMRHVIHARMTAMRSTNNTSIYENVYILWCLFWKRALFVFARSLLKLYLWQVHPVYTNNISIDKYILLGLFLQHRFWGLFLKNTPFFWGLVRCTQITMTEMQWRTACILSASWSSKTIGIWIYVSRTHMCHELTS